MFYYERVGIALYEQFQLGDHRVWLYLQALTIKQDWVGIFTLHIQRKAMTLGKAILATGAAALLLTGCAKHVTPKSVARATVIVPTGHIYPVAVDVPPPVSPSIHFSAADKVKIQQAFNVVGLKSALMVAALSCSDQTQYDAFMHSFQPHVLEAQHTLDAYFYKASGPYSGQKMEDSFITNLANNQSVAGIAQGQKFCLNSQAEFKAVLALKNNSQLDSFVTNQPPEAVVASAAPVQ